MKFNYLVDAANNIAGAIQYVEKDSKVALAPDALKEYLRHGCTSLKQISNDNDFKQLLLEKSLLSFNQSFDGQALEQYLSSFIKVDKKLMLEAGMNRKIADYLFSDINDIRKVLQSGKTPNFEVMLIQFEYLARIVCSESTVKVEEKNRMSLLRKIVKCFGGASVIAVNAASDITATYGDIISIVSIAVGGKLLEDGLFGAP